MYSFQFEAQRKASDQLQETMSFH